jgi:hypothetical protein
MFLSVCVSSADVASSSRTISGAFSSVLAMATLCFSPPDSFRPRSPTIESYPSGKDTIYEIYKASQIQL